MQNAAQKDEGFNGGHPFASSLQLNCDLCLMDYPLSSADPRLNGHGKLKQLHKHPAAEEQFSHCPCTLYGSVPALNSLECRWKDFKLLQESLIKKSSETKNSILSTHKSLNSLGIDRTLFIVWEIAVNANLL